MDTRPTPIDPRTRYRVAFDQALARGEVNERLIARGKCKPWNDYMRGAEMVERSPEEWQLVAVRRQIRNDARRRRLRFSRGDFSLSSHPHSRLSRLQEMMRLGLIDVAQARRLLDFPDISEAP